MIVNFIKRILGINYDGQPVQLFSGCANKFQKVGSSAVTHGGEIYSPRSRSGATYCFAMDTADEWVTALTSKSVTVIHAGWIVHCVDSGFRVPVAKYVLDGTEDLSIPAATLWERTDSLCVSADPAPLSHHSELFIPGSPYRVIHADSETRPDQSTDDSNTLIQLHTPSTPPPSIPGHKRKRESAYFDSPSGCYVFSEFDKDGIPRRPRKLRKLRFEPSFTPNHDKLNSTPQLICHHHPSDDFNPFITIGNTSAKNQQLDDHAVASVAVGPPRVSNSADQVSSFQAVQAHEASAAPDHSCFSVNRIHRISPKPKPVRTIDFTRLPTARRRSRFPGFDLRSGNLNRPLSINKLSDKIGATSDIAVVNSNTSNTAFSNVKQTNGDKPARKITFASHALVRLYRNRSDTDGSQESNPKPQGGTTPDTNTTSDQQRSDNVEDRRETPEVPVNENLTEPLGEATNPRPKECSDNAAPAKNGTQPKISNPFASTSEDCFRALALDVQQVLDFRKGLKRRRPECELPSGKLAMLFQTGESYRGMEFRHKW
ncbi:hypothetical protein EDC04DRAFT_3143514 [Pisolithus marmoratus]|nr:hypothetical protein EDC04DRAFT_3143514 [Pisolithus marmoratus]